MNCECVRPIPCLDDKSKDRSHHTRLQYCNNFAIHCTYTPRVSKSCRTSSLANILLSDRTKTSMPMGLKKLRSPLYRAKKKKTVVKDASRSKASVRSLVGKLSLSNLRSGRAGASSCPLPTSIQCGLSIDASPHVALAAGSYFDVETLLLRKFEAIRPGAIKSTQVGFMSPYYTHSEDVGCPTFEQVMSGRSGHIFVVRVELADPVADFEDLIRFFFKMHDPTTRYQSSKTRGQKGFQYSSWVFCGDQEQYEVVKRIRCEVQDLLNQGLLKGIYESDAVTTKMSLMNEFTPGPEEHQKHFMKNNTFEQEFQCDLPLDSWPSFGTDDASSMGTDGSIGPEEDDGVFEASKRSSHFRPKESLIHTMLRIAMTDGAKEGEEENF